MDQQAVISEQMRDYYYKRTYQHIQRVLKNMRQMVGFHDLSQQQLISRGKVHDASKFSQQEKEGYIWLTHYHKIRKTGQQYDYPNQLIKAKVKKCIDHHLKSNEHHHESFGTIENWNQNVKLIDLVQMVCDWTAMSQQYGAQTCIKWLNQNLHRFKYSQERTKQIWQIVEFLNAKNIAK